VVLPALGVVGVLGSITLDAALFAYEPSNRRDRVQLGPWATPAGDGGVALRGRF